MLVLIGQIQDHKSLAWKCRAHESPRSSGRPSVRPGSECACLFGPEGSHVSLRAGGCGIAGRIDEQTDGHDHQQGHDPLGLLRQREKTKNCGSFRKRNPHSARACPLYPSSTAWGANWPSSSPFVARISTCLVDACLTVYEPRSQGPYDMVDKGRAEAPGPGRPRFHSGAWGRRCCRRNVVCKPIGKRVSACWASASQANAVRHSVLEGFDFLGHCLVPMLVHRYAGLVAGAARIHEYPALFDPAIGRGHYTVAIAPPAGAMVWGSAWARRLVPHTRLPGPG